MAPDLDLVAVARLRRDGQRYTDNRRQLVRVLADADDPLTIPAIIGRCGLAQSSVYRNLAVLERAGVVQRIVTTDEWARYELAEELTEHHHHLICVECGLVRDFTLPPPVERSLDAALVSVASGAGFEAGHHRLDLVGRCERCA
jgi:Fur family transcriptional regulator, ferric uptake regulator